MDTGGNQENNRRQNNPEVILPLSQLASSHPAAGSDAVEGNISSTNRPQTYGYPFPIRGTDQEMAQPKGIHRVQSASMPPSPLGRHMQSAKRVLFSGHIQTLYDDKDIPIASPVSEPATSCYSQPFQKGILYPEDSNIMDSSLYHETPPRAPVNNRLRDTRYNSFRTRPVSIVERQLSRFRGKPVEPELPEQPKIVAENVAVPVDRYFDALEGPELETLRASEELVLPEDRLWPFLLRYPISSFGICLGTSSQAILWKKLVTSSSIKSLLHISPAINYALWCMSIVIMILVASIYSLKMIIYFEAVRREYYHPVRVNFFFAPWIALLFLAMGVPPSISKTLPHALWYILMTPIFCLELKIYGQWMSGGQRRLSKVANPSNHLSIVGNFVGALLGASMGLKEGPIFFFAIGLAHYTVLFVTLYQRLPTNETLPKELHPVFFLFVAAPSVASMAWARIQGSFDHGSRIVYFIALFLYFSLAVRVNFFRGFRFSIAWWAYTFPMTGAAIATIGYSNEVNNVVTRMLAVTLSGISSLTVTFLLITTVVHAFVLQDLFPNDIAIAISNSPPQPQRWFHVRNNSTELVKQFENSLSLRFLNFDTKDKEAGSVKSDGRDVESSIDFPSVINANI
uniref:S-type anion channel n=1 Tax=Dionaea muscipula TaxID=4362 RepID=A0A1C3RMA4_DIOMU|nr:S-type anion channel [Dionaea muscipula]